MKQKIVKVLNNVLLLLVAVFSIGYFMGVEAEEASAAAPTGFTSQVYGDSDGDGAIDQVVVVVNGGEALTVCAVTDAEVGADWTYTGNDIGGSLASSGNTHTCNIATATVTLKITGANANKTGHTAAPTIAYNNDDNDGSVANASGNLGTVEATNIADGAAPIAISSSYKDINSNGTVDRVDVVYSENIESSIFKESEWSFPVDPYTLVISSGVISTTDVQIAITGAPTGNTALNNIKIKYTAGTGITDGANSAVTSAELPVGDKARPIILTAVDQNGTSLDNGINIPINANIIITFSESMDKVTLDANSEWLISPDPGSWLNPSWDSLNKTLTLEKTVNFVYGDVETVTFSAPLAVSGATEGDKALQNSPAAAAVNNPFTFTVASETDDDGDDENDKITPPCGAVDGPATPNLNSGVTLYRMPNDPRVYVIKNKKKHWIKTPKEFEDNCYNWDEIQEISAELLEKYPDAEALVSKLLRAIGDHKVYKIKEGKRYWIRTAKEFEDSGYNWDEIQEVSPETLAAYQEEVVSSLLKVIGGYKVYVIKEGKKRWIKTAEEFNAEGYNWEDIQEVDEQVLNSYSDLVSSLIKIINASALRVRSVNSIMGDVLDSVKKSEVYEVIEKKNGWYKIKTKSGKSGWVSSSYAQEQ